MFYMQCHLTVFMQNGIISVLAMVTTHCLKLKPQGSLSLTRHSTKKNQQNPQPWETLHKDTDKWAQFQNFLHLWKDILHHVSSGGNLAAAKLIKAEIYIQSS